MILAFRKIRRIWWVQEVSLLFLVWVFCLVEWMEPLNMATRKYCDNCGFNLTSLSSCISAEFFYFFWIRWLIYSYINNLITCVVAGLISATLVFMSCWWSIIPSLLSYGAQWNTRFSIGLSWSNDMSKRVWHLLRIMSIMIPLHHTALLCILFFSAPTYSDQSPFSSLNRSPLHFPRIPLVCEPLEKSLVRCTNLLNEASSSETVTLQHQNPCQYLSKCLTL